MLFYKNIQKYLINTAPQSINMREKKLTKKSLWDFRVSLSSIIFKKSTNYNALAAALQEARSGWR